MTPPPHTGSATTLLERPAAERAIAVHSAPNSLITGPRENYRLAASPHRWWMVWETPPLTRQDASARITAYVYGNLVILGALLTLQSEAALSWHGALTILAAGLSTFVAHAFADLLGRRVGHDHRSVLSAALAAARDSRPIVTAAIVPIGMLAAGAWLHWPSSGVQLAAELFICARIGLIGATAERFRGRPSSHRFVLVGVGIAVAAALVAVAKVALVH